MTLPSKTFLGDILAARRQDVEGLRARTPLESLARAAEARHEFRDFSSALSGPGLHVIAELKQASPSRGVLRKDYRCREIAQAYEAAGAAAISVLTEESFFQGSLTDLIDARDATGLPVLRKDFIVDPYQVYESAAAGADALLLIVAALSDNELRELLELARRVRIAALVEVHTEAELDRALAVDARIIGVNNRDLKTFEVRLETSFRLRARIPSSCIAVSESGIKTPEDLHRLFEAGFSAVLIGEQVIAESDPGSELAHLLEGAKAAARRV